MPCPHEMWHQLADPKIRIYTKNAILPILRMDNSPSLDDGELFTSKNRAYSRTQLASVCRTSASLSGCQGLWVGPILHGCCCPLTRVEVSWGEAAVMDKRRARGHSKLADPGVPSACSGHECLALDFPPRSLMLSAEDGALLGCHAAHRHPCPTGCQAGH